MKKLLLIPALLCGTAHAEFWSGNELLARINSSESYDRGTAIGYIMGVFDATHGVSHCPPTTVTAGQVRDMVTKALNDAPSVRHLAADGFVIYPLKTAWPCAKKGTGT